MCWLPSKLQSNKSGNTCVNYLQGCEATKAVTHDCDGNCKAMKMKAVTHVWQSQVENEHYSTLSGLIRLVIFLEYFIEITPDFLYPFMND